MSSLTPHLRIAEEIPNPLTAFGQRIRYFIFNGLLLSDYFGQIVAGLKVDPTFYVGSTYRLDRNSEFLKASSLWRVLSVSVGSEGRQP